MKKQWRVLFLAAAAAVVMSTGCGNSASTQTTAATTAAETTAAETTAAEAKANFRSALSEYLQRLCQRRVPSAKPREDFPLKSKVS